LLTFTANNPLACQTVKALQLLDAESNKPIENAHFQYHQTKGISTENGIIRFSPQAPHFPLFIRQQVYGKLSFTAEEVAHFLEIGIIKLSVYEYTLAPISVIAVRPKVLPGQLQQLSQVDLLQHDATALLMQSSVISGIRKSGGHGFDAVLRGFKYDRLNIVQDGMPSAMGMIKVP